MESMVSLALYLSIILKPFGIGGRLFYREMKEISGFKRRTHGQNILLLLIESGAVYCSIQLVYSVLSMIQVYDEDIGLSFTLAATIFNALFIASSVSV